MFFGVFRLRVRFEGSVDGEAAAAAADNIFFFARVACVFHEYSATRVPRVHVAQNMSAAAAAASDSIPATKPNHKRHRTSFSNFTTRKKRRSESPIPVSRPSDDWDNVVRRAILAQRVRSGWTKGTPESIQTANKLLAVIFAHVKKHHSNDSRAMSRFQSSIARIREDIVARRGLPPINGRKVRIVSYRIPWSTYTHPQEVKIDPCLSIHDPPPDEIELHHDQYARAIDSASLDANKQRYIRFVVQSMQYPKSNSLRVKVIQQERAMKHRFQFDDMHTLNEEAKSAFNDYEKEKTAAIDGLRLEMFCALYYPYGEAIIDVDNMIYDFCRKYDVDADFIHKLSKEIFDVFCASLQLHLPQVSCPPEVLEELFANYRRCSDLS